MENMKFEKIDWNVPDVKWDLEPLNWNIPDVEWNLEPLNWELPEEKLTPEMMNWKLDPDWNSIEHCDNGQKEKVKSKQHKERV